VGRRKKRRSTRKRSPYLQSAVLEGGNHAESKPEVPETSKQTPAPISPTSIPVQEEEEQGGSSTREQQISNSSCMTPFMASATPWVRQYLESTPNDVLLPVPRDFLSDGFNLQGLQQVVERAGEAAGTGIGKYTSATCSTSRHDQSEARTVSSDNSNTTGAQERKSGPTFPLYRAALKMILSKDETAVCKQLHCGNGTTNQEAINAAAVALYTLVHSRFATSPRGLDTLRRVLRRTMSGPVEPVFGRCPRVGCNGMPLIPAGISDEYNIENNHNRKAMRYCPSCGELLHHFESNVDGSAWGTTLCHLFLMTHGHIFPEFEEQIVEVEALNSIPIDIDIDHTSTPSVGGMRPMPQIFGFPVHESQARIKYPLLKHREA